jgi:hypothetical protein
MISQPMNGVSDDQVKKIQEDLKEQFAKLHIDVCDSFLTDEVNGVNNPGVFYLGRTLEKFLCNVDAVYFVDGWQRARGCRIERHICEEYGIKVLDSSFFRDRAVETLIWASRQGRDLVRNDLTLNTKLEQFKDIDQHIPKID